MRNITISLIGLSLLVSAATSSLAFAADLAAPAPLPPPPVTGFFTGIEFHAKGEAGILGNMPNPSQGFDGKGYNLGKLTTDHANTPQLNQILLTVTKPINPSVTGFALSFNI